MGSVSRSSRAEFTWGLVLVGLGVLEAKVLQTNSPWAAPVALVIVGGLFSRLFISVLLMPVLYQMAAREGDHLEV